MSWNIFQVVADSSQGWINAILYVFFSKKMRKRLFRDSFIQLMKCCRQSVHSRRKRITSRQSKLLSEANRLVGETVNETTPHTAQGYGTHFTPSKEWPTSAQHDYRSNDSGMHSHISEDYHQTSTVSRCDTYFSTKFTDIASRT